MRLLLLATALFVSGCNCNGTATIGGRRDGGANNGGDGGNTVIPDGSTPLPDGGFTTCTSICSDDLQASIDCNGVRTQCPAGQGCSPTGCIDACAAAAAAGSTIGCDFYAAAVPPQSETQGSCYSAFVANTWNGPITLNVQRGTQTFDVSTFARIPRQSGTTLTYEPLPTIDGGVMLPAGQMAVLFLADWDYGGATPVYYVGCPSPPALRAEFQLDGTGQTPSFHITTSAPVVAYDMYPYGGADSHVSSSSLLIPTSAWGTNYVGATPADSLAGIMFPYLQVYGSQDNTQVAIQAPVAIQGGGGLSGAAANTVARYTVGRGQVLQLSQAAQLSGALIKSDKPIAVWGGHACMQVPLGVQACDSGHQQLPAVPLLGNEYLAVRHKARSGNEPAIWRFVGAVDGTQLTYDPPVGGPTTLNAGQTVNFTSAGPFKVSSQDASHIFYVSQLMTGGESAGNLGDPDFVNIVPWQQYLKSYLFFTDATYTSTDLVFVRPLGSDNQYHDVTLDCLGVVGSWFGIGGSNYQYARVSWTRTSAGCTNGVHTARSDAPFGLTVWGTDSYTSYGYPAGMSVRPINTVVVGPEIN